MGEGVASFKGIPYAAPPFGPNRLQPPQPHEPWSGVLDASDYGPTAPKAPYPAPFDTLLAEPDHPGEEYLNLNVWTPDPTGGGGRPVMVWIHGGAFTNGSGVIPTYDGTAFARDGVVLVTLNYRLGVDGFVWLSDGTPNLGLLDQIEALRWVHANIAAFGGDPNQVTIFGESAGAMSVATLLAMPAAKGLFKRAIAQSGAGMAVLSPAEAESVAARVAAKLGVPPMREAIAAVPVAALLAAQLELRSEARSASLEANRSDTPRLPFAPVVDGVILPDRPHDLIRRGDGADVDLLVGTNMEEQRLWLVPTGMIDRINQESLYKIAAERGLGLAAVNLYRETRPRASAGEILSALVTDDSFRIPAIRLAEAHAGARTYMYEFGWPSPQFAGRLGACHALEIPFVFENLDRGRSSLLGENPPTELAAEMHKSWVRFAVGGAPGWPAYDPVRRTTMQFWPMCEPHDDPRGAERAVWDGIR